jgi:hypothetical protein
MSRWRRSHQNGADEALSAVVVYDDTIACMIAVWRAMNEALLRPFRKCRQVVRKSGGSWVYAVLMNERPWCQWLLVWPVDEANSVVVAMWSWVVSVAWGSGVVLR